MSGNAQNGTEGKTEKLQERVVKIQVRVLNEGFIESLQNKLIINSTNIPILKQYHYSASDYDILVNNNDFNIKFSELYKRFKNNISAGNSKSYISKNFINGNNLFTIKQVYTQDNFYIFEDTAGNFFHANISDFDKNGVISDSLKVGKPPLDAESNLVSGFTIDNTPTTINLLKNNKVISSIVGDLIVVVNKDKGDVVVVHNNLIEYININSNGKQTDGSPISHPYGTIRKMKIDKNSNFLLFISEYDGGKTKLHIVNRKTLDEVNPTKESDFENISDILQIDNNNSNITCLNSDGKVVSINVNFEQFEVGFVDNGGKIVKKRVVQMKDATTEALLATLGNGGLSINPNNLQGNGNHDNSLDSNKKEIVDKLWQTQVGEKSFKELFDEAKSEEEIDLVYSALLQIKANPDVIAVTGITDSIEKAINEKRFKIKLEELKQSLSDLQDMFEQTIEEMELGDFSSFTNLLVLQSSIKVLKQSRSQLPIIDNDLDKVIKELSDNIEAKILEFRLKNNDAVKISISKNIEKVKEILSNIEYLSHLTQIYSSDIYKQTESMIDLLEDNEKDIFKDELRNSIAERIKEIAGEEKAKLESEEKKLREKVEEIEELLFSLSEVLDGVSEESLLDTMKNTDPLVIMIKSQFNELPKGESDRLNLTLDNLFNNRKGIIKMKLMTSVGVKQSLDEYGIDTTLYYSEIGKRQIGFKLGGHRTASGTIKLEIEYEGGIKFNIDSYLHNPSRFAHAMAFDEIEGEMSQNEFIKLQSDIDSWNRYGIDRLRNLVIELKNTQNPDERKKIIENIHKIKRKYLNIRKFNFFAENLASKLNLNPRTYLKPVNPNFIVLDEEKDIFKRLSIGFKIQKQGQRGIDVLEGPPGLGKTVMCEYFGAVTNREVIIVSCYRGMEVSDLLFSDSLKAGETRKEIANWVKLMQKPGTMVIFDEIDLLNSEVIQVLHSLADTRRSVSNPQVGEIKANPDCLFVGTCNSYNKFSSPIASRSRIQKLEYPGELNEAYKVSKYTGIEFLKKLSFDEFKKLWENNGNQGGGNLNNIVNKNMKAIYDNLDKVKKLVEFFNELRDKQSSDDYDEKFIYEISYRDASDIFDLYIHLDGVSFKNIVLDLVVPKARKVVLDNEDKDNQEKIVRSMVDKVFK